MYVLNFGKNKVISGSIVIKSETRKCTNFFLSGQHVAHEFDRPETERSEKREKRVEGRIP